MVHALITAFSWSFKSEYMFIEDIGHVIRRIQAEYVLFSYINADLISPILQISRLHYIWNRIQVYWSRSSIFRHFNTCSCILELIFYFSMNVLLKSCTEGDHQQAVLTIKFKMIWKFSVCLEPAFIMSDSYALCVAVVYLNTVTTPKARAEF